MNPFSTYIWRMVYNFDPSSFKRYTVENQEKSKNVTKDMIFFNVTKIRIAEGSFILKEIIIKSNGTRENC